MKKWISLCLCTAMLLSVLPMTGFATETETPLEETVEEVVITEDATEPAALAAASGTCGDNLTWVLDDKGTLTISGTGEMDDFEYKTIDDAGGASDSGYFRAPWYGFREDIKSVVIHSGVTNIGNGAFGYSYKNLASVTIPESVGIIGTYAFAFCTSLTDIHIPYGVAWIKQSAFTGCSSLTNISIPESVVFVENYVFNNCTSLTSVTLPKYISEIGFGWQIFQGCTSLTSVTLPEVSNAVDNRMFLGCSSLPSVVIPKSATHIGLRAFEQCSSLTSITIPKGIKNIYCGAFADCGNLKEIVFQGDAPRIHIPSFFEEDRDVFAGVTATAYYPADNATWTQDVMQDYGGHITWKPGTPSDVPTTPEVENPPAESDSIPVYRLYNQYTNEHLLVTDEGEKDGLLEAGWTLDGVAWNAPKEGTPIYRLYNPYGDFHFYTMSLEEIDNLTPLGWTVDGAVSCSAEEDGQPVYRLFNPYEQTNYHMFTAAEEERDFLAGLGWQPEGVAWYSCKN